MEGRLAAKVKRNWRARSGSPPEASLIERRSLVHARARGLLEGVAQAKELEQQRAADEAKRIKKERMEKMRKRKEARLKEEQKLKKEVRTRSRSRSRDCSESLCPCWFPKLSSSSVCRQIA